MVITSTEASKRLENVRPAAPDDSRCETCHSAVDLTTSVLMRGCRIVGCPACNWSFSAVFPPPAATASPTT